MNGRMMRVTLMLGIGLMISTATMNAQRGNRGHGGDKMGPLAALDLTETQKEQIKALHEEFKADHEDEFEQMRSLAEQMREQRQDGDREGAQATREQLKELREGMKADREELHEDIAAILTDEQRAKLEEMIANRSERDCKGKRGKRDRGGESGGETGTRGVPPTID